MTRRSRNMAFRPTIGTLVAILGLMASPGLPEDSKKPEVEKGVRDPALERIPGPGIGVPQIQQLLDLFGQSDLVITAVAGPSEILKGSDIMETELQVESVLKGKISERSVTLHSKAPHAFAERHRSFGSVHDAISDSEELVAGTKVLAFLLVSKDAAGSHGQPVYKAPIRNWIQILDDPERAAFAKRLEALAELDRKAGGIAKIAPSDLMEWLVATEEEPLTRGEAAREIEHAHDRLCDLAERKGTTEEIALRDLRATADSGGTLSEDDRLALLGAALTDGQKRRFAVALRTGRGFRRGDVWLFTFAWIWNDPDTALNSLAYRLRTAELDPEEETWAILPLRSIAKYAEDQAPLLSLFVEEFNSQHIFQHLWPEDRSDEGQRLRDETMAPLYRELRYRIAEALESRQRTLPAERGAPQETAKSDPRDVDHYRVEGTLLSEAQKKRLGEALRTAKGLTGYGDLALYDLVRGWDPDGARTWLVHQLRTAPVGTLEIDDLSEAAEGLRNKEWSALIKAAADRADEISALWPDDKSEETQKLREEKWLALGAELRHQLVEALMNPR